MLVFIHDKKRWKIVESCIISNHNTIEKRHGLFILFPYLVRWVLKIVRLHHFYIFRKIDKCMVELNRDRKKKGNTDEDGYITVYL